MESEMGVEEFEMSNLDTSVVEPSDGSSSTPAEMEEVDWKAEAEKAREEAKKWKALSRKNETEKKQLLQQSSQTDSEKLIAEAEERGRVSARAEMAQHVAIAEIRAALTGIVDDPDSVIEDLQISKFLDDDGEVDRDAIGALKTKYTNMIGKKSVTKNLGHAQSGRVQSGTPADAFAELVGGLFKE